MVQQSVEVSRIMALEAGEEWTAAAAMKARTAALLEFGAAGLRANAVLVAEGSAWNVIKAGLSGTVTMLMQALRAMLSGPGIIIGALAAWHLYYERVQAQIQAMKDMRDTILAAQDLSAKERDSLVSVTDKVQALTNQYERLNEARKKLADATDPFQQSIAQQGVDIATREYLATAAQSVQANGQPLRPSQERQNLLDQMGEMQERQLERDLPLHDQILHIENQRTELAAKRADLEKKAADAAGAAAPGQLSSMQGHLQNDQAALEQATAALDRLASHPGRGGGVAMERHAAEVKRMQDWKDAILADMDATQKKMGEYPQAVQASEAAQVDLTQNSLQDQAAADKLGELRTRQSRTSFESNQQREEAAAEQQILELKTRGYQRTLDEAHIRQELLATKQREIQADQERLNSVQPKIEAAEAAARAAFDAIPKDATADDRARQETDIRSKLAETIEKIKQDGGVIYTQEEQTTKLAETRTGLLEQQRSINEVIIAQNDEMLDQEERRNSRILGLISRLPKGLQKSLLEQMPDRLAQQASDYDKRAQQAQDAGDATGADQWRNKAEDARDEMAQIQDELRRWSTRPSILSDEAHKMGMGGRYVNYGATSGGGGNGVLDYNPFGSDVNGLGKDMRDDAIPRTLMGADPAWITKGHGAMNGRGPGGTPIVHGAPALHGADLIADRILTGNKTLERIEKALHADPANGKGTGAGFSAVTWR